MNECEHAVMLPEDSYQSKYKGNIIPDNVKNNDKIFVVTDLVKWFFDKVDPTIKNQYTLITGRSDVIVNSEISNLRSDKVIKWFSTNNTTSDVYSIPLGLDNKTWKFDDNPQADTDLLKFVMNEKIEKDFPLLVSFNVNTNREERHHAVDILLGLDNITYKKYGEKQRFDEDQLKAFYRLLKSHKFCACPWGNGPDTHRFWQCLYLNTIPIVKRHPAYKEFYGLPVLWIDDWEDLKYINLESEYEKITGNGSYPWASEKLWFDHWRKKWD